MSHLPHPNDMIDRQGGVTKISHDWRGKNNEAPPLGTRGIILSAHKMEVGSEGLLFGVKCKVESVEPHRVGYRITVRAI